MMYYHFIRIFLLVSLGSAMAFQVQAEDVDGHSVLCTGSACKFIYDFAGAADPVTQNTVQEVKPSSNAGIGFLELDGQPGFGQAKTASVFYCPKLKSGLPEQFSCDLIKREFPLNQKVRVTAGNYVFIYANSQSDLVQVAVGKSIQVALKTIHVGQIFRDGIVFGERNMVAVSRDFSNPIEQNKLLIGLYAFRPNAFLLDACAKIAALSPESSAACQVLMHNNGFADLLGAFATFDVANNNLILQDVDMDSRMEEDLPAGTGFDSVSDLSPSEDRDFVSVFPGAYEINYGSSRTGQYLAKKILVQKN
jgi:hypothetical protein